MASAIQIIIGCARLACSRAQGPVLGLAFVLPAAVHCVDGNARPSGVALDDAGDPVINVGQGGNAFVPADLSIDAGTTVAWYWVADGHSVVSGDPITCTPDQGFNTGLQETGYQFTFLFALPGTYGYFCAEHCPGMGGTIYVQ